ncbi:TPA: hypothetical protein ACKQHR_001447 [Pseudomonas aeruginosa]
MKAYIHNNAPLSNRVIVADSSGNAAPWPIEDSISDAVLMASASLKGELEGTSIVPLELFGADALLLGTVVEDDVDLDCQVMLVGYQGSQYCIICGPEMRKLSAVDRYLSDTIGTTAVELVPVSEGNVSTVLQNYHELSRAAARVTVVLDDGAVTHVEAVGVPRHVSVKIYNVVHPDDRAYKENGELGRLVLKNGLELNSVEVINADLVHIDVPLDAAVYYAN